MLGPAFCVVPEMVLPCGTPCFHESSLRFQNRRFCLQPLPLLWLRAPGVRFTSGPHVTHRANLEGLPFAVYQGLLCLPLTHAPPSYTPPSPHPPLLRRMKGAPPPPYMQTTRSPLWVVLLDMPLTSALALPPACRNLSSWERLASPPQRLPKPSY